MAFLFKGFIVIAIVGVVLKVALFAGIVVGLYLSYSLLK